jgi:hypothetical protein
MPKNASLLDVVRDQFEDSLIKTGLLAEFNATGGEIVPRTVFFTPANDGMWNVRVAAMLEPPALAKLEDCRAEALADLNRTAGDAGGAACIICSTMRDSPGGVRSARHGMAMLNWLDTEGNQYMARVQPTRDGESFESHDVDPHSWTRFLEHLERQGLEAPDTGGLAEAVLAKLVPSLTTVMKAAAPDAADDDALAEQVQANDPLWQSLKDYSALSVKLALQLSEARADTVLAHLSMTVNYLLAQQAEQADQHRETVAKLKANAEKQQSKAAAKLQRELEMTRKRADVLARQVQDAREELRVRGTTGGAPTRESDRPAPSVTSPIDPRLASPLQRRMALYLSRFPAFTPSAGG